MLFASFLVLGATAKLTQYGELHGLKPFGVMDSPIGEIATELDYEPGVHCKRVASSVCPSLCLSLYDNKTCCPGHNGDQVYMKAGSGGVEYYCCPVKVSGNQCNFAMTGVASPAVSCWSDNDCEFPEKCDGFYQECAVPIG